LKTGDVVSYATDARSIVGFKKDSKQLNIQHLNDKTLLSLLDVKSLMETLFLETGTVHAIGAD
jgi:hypothetical protein